LNDCGYGQALEADYSAAASLLNKAQLSIAEHQKEHQQLQDSLGQLEQVFFILNEDTACTCFVYSPGMPGGEALETPWHGVEQAKGERKIEESDRAGVTGKLRVASQGRGVRQGSQRARGTSTLGQARD